MLNALLKWQFPLYTADSVTFAMLLPNRIYLLARCMFYELVERRAVQQQPCTVQTGVEIGIFAANMSAKPSIQSTRCSTDHPTTTQPRSL